MMNIQATTRDAYELLHEGTLALSEIEANGIRIDVNYCKREIRRLDRYIEGLENKLDTFSEVQVWRNQYKEKFKLGSDDQLSWVLYKFLELPVIKMTKNDNESVDQSVLDTIDLEFARVLSEYKRLTKARDTYLAGILRETVNEFIHPFFNLHTVKTFRSSSSNINFQNQPIRVEEIKKIVRSAFIPRTGNRIGGMDYSGIEVRTSACYHQDPVMLKYINDPTTDMHRDQAMTEFLLDELEVSDDIRFIAKNTFVFAQFYGDYWKNCAEGAWALIDIMKAKTKSGVPIKEHLRSKGIKGLGTLDNNGKPAKGSFYYIVQQAEDIFWNERFKVYAQWKKDWLKTYEGKGYIDMFTGFRCSGIMGKNDVVNYPIQGSAFHCLLWSLIRVLQWVKEQLRATKIVGQIHDEIVSDAHPEELNKYLIAANKIMCHDIKDAWKWIIVPLKIDAEFAPVDKSWYEVEKIKIPKSSDFESLENTVRDYNRLVRYD